MAETGEQLSAAAGPPPPEAPDAAARKKKRRPYRHKKFGCTVAEQIMKAVAMTKERCGLSVSAMKKILTASGCNLQRHNSRVNRAVRSLLSRGSLVQTGGYGASGSVRLGGRPQEPAAARRAVLAARRGRRPAAPRRHSRLKKAAGGSRKPGALRKAKRCKAGRARGAAVRRRTPKGAKGKAKGVSDSVKPTNLDQQATPSKVFDPDKG